MEQEVARHLIRTAFRACRELEDLLGILKEHSSSEQYPDLAKGVARAIDAINVALLNKALAAHPELESEIEVRMRRYGRYL